MQKRKQEPLDWNALRTVLALARSGSLAGAARALDLQHSTVFRRIEDIEQRLGQRLFERARSGWQANAQGERLAQAAAEMEAAALAAERALDGADTRLDGVLRVATSEALASYLLPALLTRFLAAHPGLEIEIDASNRSVDLTRREADLALRATQQPPDSLVGQQLAEIRYAVFAAPSLLGRTAPQLDALPWIGFDERISHFAIARWLRAQFPEMKPRLRADSISVLVKLAAAGAGAVVLPAFAGAQEPGLRRVTPLIEGPSMGLWLLKHPDLRGNARVRALSQFLADTVPAHLQALTEGGPCARQMADCPARAPRRRARTQAP